MNIKERIILVDRETRRNVSVFLSRTGLLAGFIAALAITFALACNLIAALLNDLSERHLYRDTLILWGGKFGREKTAKHKGGGSGHNNKGDTMWMAGGGAKLTERCSGRDVRLAEVQGNVVKEILA
jgi:hypothetical protein